MAPVDATIRRSAVSGWSVDGGGRLVLGLKKVQGGQWMSLNLQSSEGAEREPVMCLILMHINLPALILLNTISSDKYKFFFLMDVSILGCQ